jgi:hypothetical protein
MLLTTKGKKLSLSLTRCLPHQSTPPFVVTQLCKVEIITVIFHTNGAIYRLFTTVWSGTSIRVVDATDGLIGAI